MGYRRCSLPGRLAAALKDLPADCFTSTADDPADDEPTILPTIQSVGIAGLPTIPTILFY
jgi:hypothetical protein